MDKSAITFSLKKRKDGVLTGFSLKAIETYAECFCVSFPFAQMKGKACIEFSDGKVRFIHDGISSDETPEQLGIYGGSTAGFYENNIAIEDATALQDFLRRRGRYEGVNIKFRLDFAFGRGFELTAESSQ